MPAIIRGKAALASCSKDARVTSRFIPVAPTEPWSATWSSLSLSAGSAGRHGIQHLLYVMHGIKLSLSTLHHDYRFRFGIETSYRIKLSHSAPPLKNPVVRLLFVALAFVLVNLWVCLAFCQSQWLRAPKRLSPFIPTQDDVRVPSPGGRAPFSSGSSHFLTFNRLNLSIY